MIKTFYQLCNMSQKDLKSHLELELNKTYANIKSQDGFIYAQGSLPILLVAHLDTVHKDLPESIIYSPQNQTISSPNGIGGDDRCGVYMILEVIKKHNCSVLFCEDEEIGGIGAHKFIDAKIKDLNFNYIIEFDRKGSNDAVFYNCDNPEFEEFITKEFYKTAYGSFSDISIIAPHLGCAAVNLSCGYYNAHTAGEYVVFSEMINSIEAACKIIERTTEDDKFEYIETTGYTFGYYSDSYGQKFDDYMLEYYLFQYTDEYGTEQWFETEACSFEEAVGMFCIRYPHLSFNNIIDVYNDDENANLR